MKKQLKIEQLSRGYLTVASLGEHQDPEVKAYENPVEMMQDVCAFFEVPAVVPTCKFQGIPDFVREAHTPDAEPPLEDALPPKATLPPATDEGFDPARSNIAENREAAIKWLEENGVTVPPRTRTATIEKMVYDKIAELAKAQLEPTPEPADQVAAQEQTPATEEPAVEDAPTASDDGDHSCPFCHGKKDLFGMGIVCLYCTGEERPLKKDDFVYYGNKAANSLPATRKIGGKIVENIELKKMVTKAVVTSLATYGAKTLSDLKPETYADFAETMVSNIEPIVLGTEPAGATSGDDEWAM